MATVYFTTTGPARVRGKFTAPAGNYFIEGMDGFTSHEEVFSVAIAREHKNLVQDMWLQYNNRVVVDLFTGAEIYGDELSEFAQTKLTATKWGEQPTEFPFGSARFLNNGFSKKASG